MESMYSGLGSEMLGLDRSIHHQSRQNPNSHLHLQHSNPQMVSFGDQSHNQAPKPGYSSYTPNGGTKQVTLNSDDDEAGLHLDQDSANGSDGKMKNNNANNTSPWQRMKWTDSMVKLLIMVVFYIGDEVSSDAADPTGKKKAVGGGGGSGVLQKKGKWKSVSKAMMERGYCVSPQQCEDKFNDLNKRYKRVNDILGKGTSCKVVENQSLLDHMDHLSQRLKDEVKKLLNSKHLFFKEMCAYHNSCGHDIGGGGSSVAHLVIPAEKPSHPHHQSQEKCLHSTEGMKLLEDDDDENDDDDLLDEDDNNNNINMYEEENGHEDAERNLRKRARIGESDLIRQLSQELMSVMEDGTKSEAEKRLWLKGKMLSLEEKRVVFNVEAFELEKRRLKWVKFSGKKEREMERDKIKNDRSKLETERMILMLRQKGLELVQQPLSQYSSSSDKRRIHPSSTA